MKLSRLDKIIQTRIKNIKNNGTNIFTFSHQICLNLPLLINLKLLLKKLDVRVEFLNTGNLHKNLYKLILKYIFDRLKPTQSKDSSLYLNLFSNSPCFPTIFIIFLFAPFNRSSYFFTKDIPSFDSFAFFTSSFI